MSDRRHNRNNRGKTPSHDGRPRRPAHSTAAGEVLEGEVVKITDFGAFVKLPGGRLGLVHISQIAQNYVEKISDHLKVGDKVTARVVQVKDDGKIDLTLKAPKEQGNSFPKNKEFKINIFEEKINEFLQQKQKKPDLKTV